MLRAWVLMAALQGGPSVQPPVVVRDPGPGPVGRHLVEVLERKNTMVISGDTIVLLDQRTSPSRDLDSKREFAGSVVVIAKRAVVDGSIDGDVIVVGGDLFLHPHARIGGEAIAVGGAVYPSLLAEVHNGSSSYRDFTFAAQTVEGTIELRYQELNAPAPNHPILPIPSWLTTTLPSYDRSDGLSVSLGPTVDLGPVNATALGTYRSQLGQVDPSATVAWRAARTIRVDLFAGRDTRTNEGWINSSISNSLNTLLAGHDARNWYRADAADLTVTKTLDFPTAIVAPRISARYEKASSARPEIPPISHPWSLTDRNDPADEMRRLNPAIPTSTMTSALVGTTVAWPGDIARGSLDTWVEVPIHIDGNARFTQFTLDGQVIVPTIGNQRLRLDAHGVLTVGDTAPRQRWAYIGGSGTLSTMDSLLAEGGGRLLFAEARYVIPIDRIQLPLVGAPVLALRYLAGGAGPTSIPTVTQIAGIRLSVALIRGEYLYDLTSAHSRFHIDLSITR